MNPHQQYMMLQRLDMVLLVSVPSFIGLWLIFLILRHKRNPCREYPAWWAKEKENWGWFAYLFRFYDWLVDATVALVLLYVLWRHAYGISF